MGSTTPACEPRVICIIDYSLINCNSWMIPRIFFTTDKVCLLGQGVPLCIVDCLANTSCGGRSRLQGSRTRQPYNRDNKHVIWVIRRRPMTHRIEIRARKPRHTDIWIRTGFGERPVQQTQIRFLNNYTDRKQDIGLRKRLTTKSN